MTKVVAVGPFAAAGAEGGCGGGGASKGGESARTGEEEERMQPIERLPDEVLYIVFSQLDAKTLMVSIPHVCKLWRALCHDILEVHLDFSWWGEKDEDGDLEGKHVPVEVLAGWRQTPFMLSVDSDSTDGCAEEACGWKTGLCELFPRTASVTMGGENVQDAHLLALAAKCPGIARANFRGCNNPTDAARGCVCRQVPWSHARRLPLVQEPYGCSKRSCHLAQRPTPASNLQLYLRSLWLN